MIKGNKNSNLMFKNTIDMINLEGSKKLNPSKRLTKKLNLLQYQLDNI